MKHGYVLLGGAVLAAYGLYYRYYDSQRAKVLSRTGDEYTVQHTQRDAAEAAEILAELETLAEKIIQATVSLRDDNNAWANLARRFRKGTLEESLPNSTTTSYSENKGERIIVCLRSKDSSNRLIERNTIRFVFLHELAHLMTDSVGHDPEFWANFKTLLKKAVELGLYSPVDYEASPVSYCGMTVSDNPLFR